MQMLTEDRLRSWAINSFAYLVAVPPSRLDIVGEDSANLASALSILRVHGPADVVDVVLGVVVAGDGSSVGSAAAATAAAIAAAAGPKASAIAAAAAASGADSAAYGAACQRLLIEREAKCLHTTAATAALLKADSTSSR